MIALRCLLVSQGRWLLVHHAHSLATDGRAGGDEKKRTSECDMGELARSRAFCGSLPLLHLARGSRPKKHLATPSDRVRRLLPTATRGTAAAVAPHLGAVRDQASDPRATHRISMPFIINICCFVERRKDRSYTDLLVVCSNPSMSRSQGELAAVERMATYISVVPSTRNNSCISVVMLHGTSLNLSLFFNQLKSTW
jgi:hypothetical protein